MSKKTCKHPLFIAVAFISMATGLMTWTGCGQQASVPATSTGTPESSAPDTVATAKQPAAEQPAVKQPAVEPAPVPQASALPAVSPAAEPAPSAAPAKSPEVPKAVEKKPIPTNEIETNLKEFNSLTVSTEELTSEDANKYDKLHEPLKTLKALCQQYQLKPSLQYTPFFEAKEAKFLVREKTPWHWEFCVQKKADEIRDCVELNMTGPEPVLSVTKEGRWRFPETIMIPFGVLTFSLVDKGGATVGKPVVFSMLKPQKVTASVYFPDGTAPQFMERMFDLNLITSAGQIAFSGEAALFVQPVGKAPIRIPVMEYYKKKKEEKEKERGAAFGTTAGPSPEGDSIGTVIYWDVNEHHLGKLGVSDKNDIGYDFYLENASKQKITLYEARP